MKIVMRLILLLALSVAALMVAEGYVSFRQSEAIVKTTVRDELRAHALSLQITLEDQFSAGEMAEAQRLIDHLSENRQLYGALLFDERGQMVMVSDPSIADVLAYPDEVRRVIATGIAGEIVRRINGQDVLAIILPVRLSATRRGAFEIVQPLTLMEADLTGIRRHFAVTRLSLIVVILLGILLVMYQMSRRLNEQKQAALSAAEERFRLKQELQQSERLAAVGRLAAGVAHELGTPLNVIDVRAKQLLTREDQPPDVSERYLRIIRTQVRDMTHIVRQLLTLAQPLQLCPAAIELRHMISETLVLLEAESSDGIKIEFAPSAEATISGDEKLLRQALLNLFRNSVQAMPAGGRLEIAIEAPPMIREGREFVAVRIADSGTGIAPEHLAHIFDPFYTTKDIGLGSGLGLSVASRIVAEHGGWIAAENAAAGGAVFMVYLAQANQPESGRGETQ